MVSFGLKGKGFNSRKMIVELFGYLSGVAILLSFVPYTIDILKGRTRPERISWLIWGLLGSVFFFSQLAKGGTYSNILAGVQTIGDFFIFLLAIKYGIGGFMKRDIIGFAGALLGLFLWYITKEAAIALFLAIFVDAIGTGLTVVKSYELPETENITAWLLTFLGGLFACVAVGSFDLILLALPIYICLASLSILTAIGIGRRHKLKYQNEVSK